MRFYRVLTNRGELHLCVELQDGTLSDVTSAHPDVQDLHPLAQAAYLSGTSLDSIAQNLLKGKQPKTYSLQQLVNDSRAGRSELRLARPIDPPEVWAVGVTYKSSEMERRRESQTPDVYAKVYAAPRPEIFFKGTPHRCAGPFEQVGIRGDSIWNVPEPELTLVLFKGKIIGYTIGNDMSSRSIEGENPLYLPQAKIYDKSCAIGPCVATELSVPDPHKLTMRCTITHGSKEVFKGETSTSQMARRCVDLADWLYRHNPVPDMSVVLTGTAIVPPPDFTLAPGDVVRIEIENIGVLENTVVQV